MLKWKSHLAVFVFTYKKPKKKNGRVMAGWKNGYTPLLFSESIPFEI